MERDFASSSNEVEALPRELARGHMRHRQVPGELRGHEQRQNRNGLRREYMDIVREIIAHQVGETISRYVVSITVLIFLIVTTMIFSHVFHCEWISGGLVVLVMVATGMRFAWLRWNGMRNPVIRIPIDVYVPNI